MATEQGLPRAQPGRALTVLFGSNFKVGQTAEFAHIALTRMGHRVIAFTPSADAPADWIRAAPDVDMVELIRGLGAEPDLFLMVESSVGTPFLPRRIAELQIPTGYWMYDNYLNFRWNKEAAALFDYVFFAQVNRMELAKRYGAHNVTWVPFAADEVFHRDFHLPRDIDIGYVGSITAQKERYFRSLTKAGLKVITNDRYLSYEDIGEFYSRCKLVYNILARRDMNVRTFEASAAGALVVNQRWIDEGCGMIFTEGENMMFHDFDDAPDIIRPLLADDARRERMAQSAARLVMGAHTYRHRMQTILDTMAGGVMRERLERNSSYHAPLAEALVCQHPSFRWRARAWECFRAAWRRSPLRTLMHLVKYSWYRIMEKVEKTIWSLGKAPA